MSLVVQKFGGTSLADEASRESLCSKVAKARQDGDEVVVVVSAMGRLGEPYATDTLLDLFSTVPGGVDPQVEDLMLSCGEVISACLIASLLSAKGVKAVPLTAYTAGIKAEGPCGDATVSSVDARVLRSHLDAGQVPVVTGFQGVDAEGNLLTLGRGGSDTTAVAIGAALGADYVDIYKDVIGVAKADPRVIPDAPYMSFLDYDSMFRLARHGSRVLHDKSASLAQKAGLKLRIRPTFEDGEGTLIAAAEAGGASPRFIGLATTAAHAHEAGLLVTAVFSKDREVESVTKAINFAAVSGYAVKQVPSGDSAAASFLCDASMGKAFAKALFTELIRE